jgi:hypothetical protein
MKTLTEDKLMIYRPKDLISSLLQQNYKTLSKEKDKFEDSLFPPNEFSIHSGYSKPKEEVKVAEVPSFIKVILSLPRNNYHKKKQHRWLTLETI